CFSFSTTAVGAFSLMLHVISDRRFMRSDNQKRKFCMTKQTFSHTSHGPTLEPVASMCRYGNEVTATYHLRPFINVAGFCYSDETFSYIVSVLTPARSLEK